MKFSVHRVSGAINQSNLDSFLENLPKQNSEQSYHPGTSV